VIEIKKIKRDLHSVRRADDLKKLHLRDRAPFDKAPPELMHSWHRESYK